MTAVPPRQARGPIRQVVDALAAGRPGDSLFISCADAGGIPPHVLNQRVGSALYKASDTPGWAERRLVTEGGLDGVRIWRVAQPGKRRPRSAWTPRGARPAKDRLVEHISRCLRVPTQSARLAAALLDGPVPASVLGELLQGSPGNLRSMAHRLREGLYYTSSKALEQSVLNVSYYDLTAAARDLLKALRDEIQPQEPEQCEP